MAKMLKYTTVLKNAPSALLCEKQLPILSKSLCSNVKVDSVRDNDFEEIKIPVPWGHISCVRMGPLTDKPILSFHGWQDNAFTWKNLVKHLPSDVCLIAAEFPGHGKSSRYPPGMFYNFSDNVFTLRRVLKYFGWKSTPILAHSMGAITSFLYTSLFPDEIKFLILLDNLKPMTGPLRKPIERLHETFKKLLEIDGKINEGGEPPSYTYEDIVERLYLGALKSIDKDKCHIMLERAIAESSKEANKFYFTRDARLKYMPELRLSLDIVKSMTDHITCPVLHFKAENWSYFEPKEEYDIILNILKEKNKNFEYHVVPGTHHVHLNNPEILAPTINDFIKKHY